MCDSEWYILLTAVLLNRNTESERDHMVLIASDIQVALMANAIQLEILGA